MSLYYIPQIIVVASWSRLLEFCKSSRIHDGFCRSAEQQALYLYSLRGCLFLTAKSYARPTVYPDGLDYCCGEKVILAVERLLVIRLWSHVEHLKLFIMLSIDIALPLLLLVPRYGWQPPTGYQ